MPELGPSGSVRGARGNSRPYRDSGRPTLGKLRLSHSDNAIGARWDTSRQIYYAARLGYA
jgi:hypothetical protein